MLKRITVGLVMFVVLAAIGGVVWFGFFSPYKLYVVHTGSMEPTIPTKSLEVVHTGQYHVGQVVSFRVNGETVTHRLIGFNGEGLTITKGDADRSADPWHVPKSNIIGGVVAAPRYLGWVMVSLRQPTNLLSLGLLAVAWLLWGSDSKKSSPKKHLPAHTAAP